MRTFLAVELWVVTWVLNFVELCTRFHLCIWHPLCWWFINWLIIKKEKPREELAMDLRSVKSLSFGLSGVKIVFYIFWQLAMIWFSYFRFFFHYYTTQVYTHLIHHLIVCHFVFLFCFRVSFVLSQLFNTTCRHSMYFEVSYHFNQTFHV